MSNIKKKQDKNFNNKHKHLRNQPAFSIRKPVLQPPLRLKSFPTTKEIMKLVEKLISKPKVARFPNSFLIYRNTYVKYLKDNGHSIPMTQLSTMVKLSWKSEPYHVKETYTKISSEIEELYNQIVGTNHLMKNQLSLDEHLSTKSQLPIDGFDFSNESHSNPFVTIPSYPSYPLGEPLFDPPFVLIPSCPPYPLYNHLYQMGCTNIPIFYMNDEINETSSAENEISNQQLLSLHNFYQ
ncbi:197_t:CDS:1 [Acaulospora morrowiae]|uniref:197_t:CDS:1 n=1 Tax=Acaulospora morrowiae TaxID=94023 RepID=A0A9N9A955_9GLOM|nr:197_t:CDS:1 [Acaulospora morrowiae]